MSISGEISECCYEDGSKGKLADISISITGEASIGYGTSGNKHKQRAKKPSNGGGSGLRYRKGTVKDGTKVGGRYAKGETGWNGTGSVEVEYSSNLPKCETTFYASATFEIGGKLGAGYSVNPYANIEVSTYEEVNFSYGVRHGFSGYVGAEIYVSVSGTGGGRIVL